MRILLFVFLLLCTVSIAKAQPTALRDARILPPTKPYNPFEGTAQKTVDKFIRDYNKGGAPLVEFRFKNFRPLAPDLESDLAKAFKNHVFSVAALRVYHHVWSDGPDYVIIIERKTRRVIYSAFNPIDGSGNPTDSFADFLTLPR